LPYSDLWPKDERFIFTQIDQGDQCLLKKFYSQAQFDLIIEDGSHDPFHQIIALIHGITKINSGGLYILEDIHTSHPSYESKKLNGTDVGCSSGNLNALSALLAIQHYKRLGIAIDLQIAKDIEKGPLISSKEIVLLDSKISNISLFRRAHLPDRCFNCGNIHFKYNKLKCNCGVEIFSDSDSMSFVLEVK
jgi:hypothetical protein